MTLTTSVIGVDKTKQTKMLWFPGADFTAAKGILALINEFTMRKQPLFFFNTRKEVVSVFQGVMSGDFKYFNTKEDLEKQLEGKIGKKIVYLV